MRHSKNLEHIPFPRERNTLERPDSEVRQQLRARDTTIEPVAGRPLILAFDLRPDIVIPGPRVCCGADSLIVSGLDSGPGGPE